MSDNNAKNLPLSDSDVAHLTQCIASMFPMVKHFGQSVESFNPENLDHLEVVTLRAIKAMRETAKAKREAEVRLYRAAVEGVIRNALKETERAQAEYASLSPTLRALLPALPESISIPLSDFGDCFPEGTTKERMVAVLHTLNYKLVKGRQDETGPRVSIPLVQKSAPVPPNRAQNAA
jgi:hypothetical protein